MNFWLKADLLPGFLQDIGQAVKLDIEIQIFWIEDQMPLKTILVPVKGSDGARRLSAGRDLFMLSNMYN